MTAATVSLVIPTFRREALLVGTLRCALAQDVPDAQIMVVDQTPVHEPPTREFLAAHAERLEVVQLSEPGLARARNEGLARARGEVVVFVDDDTEFAPDFLSRHLAAHGAGADLVAGRVIPPDRAVAPKPVWVDRLLRFSGGMSCDRPGPTNVVEGCNFSVGRRALAALGGFDEGFTGVSVREDADFGLRAHRAGFRVVFEPTASVVHLASPSGGCGGDRPPRQLDPSYHCCERLFARKHFPWPVVLLYRVRLFLRRMQAHKRRLMRPGKPVSP